MSRQEVADAVNRFLYQRYGRRASVDETYVGKLERGEHRWPGNQYREAFRAVLQVETDAQLGFFIIRGAARIQTFAGNPPADMSASDTKELAADARSSHPLAAVRYGRHWSTTDLAGLLTRRLGQSQVDVKTILEWEGWSATPDPNVQLALAEELGVPSNIVRTLPWPHWLPVPARRQLPTEWSWDDALDALNREATSAMLDRRRFLALGAGATAAFTDQWVHADLPRLTPALAGGRLDLETVICLEQRLPSIRSLDASLGGARIRAAADAELRIVADLLKSSRYDERAGRRLAGVAAELGRLAGYASFDSGFHAAAQRYWVAALQVSNAAGDRLLGANILKCMSLQQMDLNQPSEALSIAQSALEGARQAPARINAMLAIRLARTCAATGDRSAAERLIGNAESAMSRTDRSAVPAWANYFDEAEYCAQAAACHRLMSRPAKVEYWLSQSLALQPQSRRRDRATYQIWRAENLIDLGDIELACAQTQSALPDLQASSSARNLRRLQRLRGRLDRHSALPVVSELLDQLDCTELS